MNRRNVLKSILSLPFVPKITTANKEKIYNPEHLGGILMNELGQFGYFRDWWWIWKPNNWNLPYLKPKYISHMYEQSILMLNKNGECSTNFEEWRNRIEVCSRSNLHRWVFLRKQQNVLIALTSLGFLHSISLPGKSLYLLDFQLEYKSCQILEGMTMNEIWEDFHKLAHLRVPFKSGIKEEPESFSRFTSIGIGRTDWWI